MSVYYLNNISTLLIEKGFEINTHDPSFNEQKAKSLEYEYQLTPDDMNRLFFSVYGIEFITAYFNSNKLPLRVVTHPICTNTCFEKADILGCWDPLNVIKAFYFECSVNELLYVVVIPETGCFIDKERIKDILGLPSESLIRKADRLPINMSPGTCSPFIIESDLNTNGGHIAKVLFDTESLYSKKDDNSLDDFSFGRDHRLSVQMNYYHCYRMLKDRYPDVIYNDEVFSLSFKEKFVRAKGKIRINYEFRSLNYRTAKFINSIHGYGDVTVINDYLDELDLPNVLTQGRR